METNEIQVRFFQHIKSALPSHVSLVDAIADLLDISTDSAYRRIRGEKQISLEEMQKLASHYRISLDQFLQLQSDSFLFSGRLANAKDHIFDKWLENVWQHYQYFASFRRKHVIYLAKDLPLMQQFLLPEIAAFKFFFWRKSILHYDDMRGHKFSLKNADPRQMELGKKVVALYNQLGSTDIWNIESINSTIRQIEFYRDANMFETQDDLKNVYAALFRLIDHLEKQAELGVKFSVGEQPLPGSAPYNLYNNELILGDNTLLFELDDMKLTFLNHSVINFVYTRDEVFNSYIHAALQNLIRKSTPLSVSNEKERSRFFSRVRERIQAAARL